MHPKADSEKRSNFCQKLEQYRKEGRSLVWLDESGFAHDMPRIYGYAPQGERCYGIHDWSSRGRTNVIGALLGTILLTISLFSTSINTQTFTGWITQDLLPKLPPKSVIILDNASFHKGIAMQQAIQQAGHTLLYLPPYSPDLNPIEHKWAQAKSLRRKYRCDIQQLFVDYVI